MTFDYVEPDTLEEAVARLADAPDDAVALAGGTAFTILWQGGLVRPSVVVGLRRVADLHGIRATDEGLRIGAMARHREVEVSADAAGLHPELAATFGRVATVRIRNQATVGGNLAHADPAQDPPPTLIALGAWADVTGPAGDRVVPIDELFVDYLTTVLEPGELIRAVVVPRPAPGTAVAAAKYLPRSEDDYATVAVAAAVHRAADGTIESARIGLGGVGPTPIRARAVEAALTGARSSDARIDEVAALVRDEVDPLDDARGSAAYKREMSRVWLARVLREVLT